MTDVTDAVVVLRCPRDDTPLHDTGRRAYDCPTCHWEFVISITDAHATTTWNRHAPGAGAVLAVIEADRDTKKGN